MPEAFSTLGILALYAAARASTAVSPTAQTLRKNAYAVVASAERSRALFGDKSDAISAVWQVAADQSTEDWDGTGGAAVDALAACNAVEFLRALPAGTPLPEVSPEPDGCISLDWIESRNRLFSLSIGSNRRLPYAWLDGTDRGHGVATFDGEEVPPRILEEIRKIRFDAAPAIRTA